MKKVLLWGLVALLALPLTYLSWTAADVYQTSRRDERLAADAIVVMGAAQYDGAPSPVFRSRLDKAKELYHDGTAPLIVVLGGKREGDRFTEAQAGAAYLEAELPADKVTGVKAGKNTLESLQLFKGVAQERKLSKIVIVSDPLHLARSKAMAEDLGFEVTVSGAHQHKERESKREQLARETILLVYYRIFGKG